VCEGGGECMIYSSPPPVGVEKFSLRTPFFLAAAASGRMFSSFAGLKILPARTRCASHTRTRAHARKLSLVCVVETIKAAAAEKGSS